MKCKDNCLNKQFYESRISRKKGEFLRILERGAAKYNGNKTKQPISVSDLIKMRKRQEKFIHNQFDPDIYLKPYTLERQW